MVVLNRTAPLIPIYIMMVAEGGHNRIDSKKDYVRGNVVLCCLGMNHFKGMHDVEYMYVVLKMFYNGAAKKETMELTVLPRPAIHC